MLFLILLVFAFVFFVLAGLGLPNPPRFQFGWWGLAFAALAVIVDRIPQLHIP